MWAQSWLRRVDGFRAYLQTAEADHATLPRVPDLDPDQFSPYLPYAIVLASPSSGPGPRRWWTHSQTP
jgi:hypothetical protein